MWFLLRLVSSEEALKLDACDKPEFDIWRWVDFWYPAAHVVNFKRQVYERALRHFAPLVEEPVQRGAGHAAAAGRRDRDAADRARQWSRGGLSETHCS